MYVTCNKCGQAYNDEYRSTICPHNGLNGLCVKCDSYVCTCSKEVEISSQEKREPKFSEGQTVVIRDTGQICQIDSIFEGFINGGEPRFSYHLKSNALWYSEEALKEGPKYRVGDHITYQSKVEFTTGIVEITAVGFDSELDTYRYEFDYLPYRRSEEDITPGEIVQDLPDVENTVQSENSVLSGENSPIEPLQRGINLKEFLLKVLKVRLMGWQLDILNEMEDRNSAAGYTRFVENPFDLSLEGGVRYSPITTGTVEGDVSYFLMNHLNAVTHTRLKDIVKAELSSYLLTKGWSVDVVRSTVEKVAQNLKG